MTNAYMFDVFSSELMLL